MSSEPISIQKYQPPVQQHMMIIPSQNELDSLRAMAEMAAKSVFYKDINSLEKAATVMLQGLELGMTPMASLRNINIIDGKPSLAANLMAAIVVAKGHPRIRVVEWTERLCTLKAKRVEETEWEQYTYTWEDAQKAGLTGKRNWQGYPKAMLYARCMSTIAKVVFPELFAGIYTPEELQNQDDFEGETLVLNNTTSTGNSSRAESAAQIFDGATIVEQAPPPAPALPKLAASACLEWISKLGIHSDSKQASKLICQEMGWTNLNDRKAQLWQSGETDPFRAVLKEVVEHFAASIPGFNWHWAAEQGLPIEAEDVPFEAQLEEAHEGEATVAELLNKEPEAPADIPF
jgi:hypothetical protein